MAAKEKPN